MKTVLICRIVCSLHICIPAKPLHNCDIVSVHFNHFHCMRICDKLSRHLSVNLHIHVFQHG